MRSGPGRSPSAEMAAADALEIIELLESVDIDVWLDGGWAVDAAFGIQRRPHDDLDVVVRLEDLHRLQDALGRLGYERVRGKPPKSFELVTGDGRQVDVHPVVFSESGNGLYLMDDGETWVYPAGGFAGVGRICEHAVRCLTPEVQLLCHTGYTPHQTSYDDVWALSRRFELEVPEGYRSPRDAYPVREP